MWFGGSWVFLGRLHHLFEAYQSSFEAWIMAVDSSRTRVMRKVSFFAVMLVIWKRKEREVFEGSPSSVRLQQIKVKFYVALWVSVLPLFRGIPLSTIISRPAWSPPPSGFFKLNFDGSTVGSPGLDWVRRVIQDSNESSVTSFFLALMVLVQSTKRKWQLWEWASVKLIVLVFVTSLSNGTLYELLHGPQWEVQSTMGIGGMLKKRFLT